MSPDSIRELLQSAAQSEGFAAAGIAPVPLPGSEEDQQERERFAGWLDAGRAGEMEYLKRQDEAGQWLRSSVRVAFPWARSVVVCATNYNPAAPRSLDAAPEGSGWIARYAWSSSGQRPSDYHKVLRRRLDRLRDRLAAALGPFGSRCFVDTGPVVERVYARYAGLGWAGKNTCLLNERLGSWLFLGVIVTSLDIEVDRKPALAPDRCGSCTRCIDACPTQALIAPRQMDATRCISYLTIEKRGSIPEDLRGAVGRQVFGCDICQDVCPWNRRAPTAADPELAPRPELVNPALDWLAGMDEEAFDRWFNGSPVRRAKFSGFRRNIAVAMGNSGQQRFRSMLQRWAGDEDSVLGETAQWAIQKLDREAAAIEETPLPD